MHNQHTNYQTSFCIEKSDANSFSRVQEVVRQWLISKKKEKSLSKFHQEFSSSEQWRLVEAAHGELEVCASIIDGEKIWAMRYSHKCVQFPGRRKWHVDVGLRECIDNICFFTKVSFSWSGDRLTGDNPEPPPTVPHYVKRIINEGFRVYSGRKEFRLISKPVVFERPGIGKALVDFIQARDRMYPLVVFNGCSEGHVIESEKLSTELLGKAQVARITDDKELAEELRHYLPWQFHVKRDTMRIFFPMRTPDSTGIRHRWYDIFEDEYVSQRSAIVENLLRNNSVIEPKSIESIDAVRHFAARAQILALKGGLEKSTADWDRYYTFVSEAEQQRDEFKRKYEEAKEKLSEAKSEIRQLEWRASDLQSRVDGFKQKVDVSALVSVFKKLPDNLRECMELARAIFYNLDFSEASIKSASDDNENPCVSEAWSMFYDLHFHLHNLKFLIPGIKDLEARFKEHSRFELGMSEGKNTKKDARLMALRQVTHRGQVFEITPHLKYGNKPPKMLRVHFAFDEELSKIVVGFVGSHLENATSRKYS